MVAADLEAPGAAAAGDEEAARREHNRSCWLGQQLAGTLFGVIAGFLAFLLARSDWAALPAVAAFASCGVYGVGTQHLGEAHVDAPLMGRTFLGGAAGALLALLPTGGDGDGGMAFVLLGSVTAAMGGMLAFHYLAPGVWGRLWRKMRTR